MAITLVGTSGAGVDSGSLTLTLPTGIGIGDAVGVVALASTTITLTTPAGWTLRAGWPKDGGNARFWLFTKTSVTAADAGATASFTPSVATKLVGAAFALRSPTGFASDWADAITFTPHDVTGTNYVAPASTSTRAGDWGLAIFGTRGTSPTNWTPAAGLTERQDLIRTGTGATALHLTDSNGSVGGAGTSWGPFTETNIASSNGGALTWLVAEQVAAVEGDIFKDSYGGGTVPAPGTLYPKLGHYRGRTGLTWRQAQDQAEAVYGPFQGHWGHYDGVGSAPLGADTTTAINDGKRVHLYWKPYTTDWAQVASGGRDTQIDDFAADIVALAPDPGQVWITIHHEPEDDYINAGSGGTGWTAANYRGMWQRVVSRFVTAGADQYVTWVCAFQHFESHPNEMITLWGNDGVMDGLIDIVACQPYIGPTTTPTNLANRYINNLEWLKTNESSGRHWGYLSKPQAVTETGADINAARGTDTHRAQAIDGIRAKLSDLAVRNLVEIRWFDFGDVEWIADPPSVDGVAYQALKEASESGQATGPIAAAGVALARDGTTGTSTTVGFVLPSGWQQGDYATVWIVTNGTPTVTTTPTGWTLAEGPVTTGASNGRAWRYARFLQAGEANPTWTLSSAERPSGVMVLLRGADTTTPVVASAALAAVAPATSLAAAAVTVPGGAQAEIITAWLGRWADASSNGGVNYGVAPATHTTLGRVSVNSGANAGSGALVAKLAASPVGAGSYGPYTSTWPITTTGITGQLAIQPAVVTPPPPATVFGTVNGLFGPLIGTAVGAATPSGPAPTLIPDPQVLVAFASQPLAPAPIYTALPGSGVGAVQRPIEITHGRQDEFSEVQPGTMAAGLRNDDGRYTMGKTNGPHGSGVRVGRRGRVQYTYQSQLHVRHDGHANGWPTSWPVGGGTFAWSELSFTDRLKRLGSARKSVLRSMLEEEVLRDNPAVYYPLGESEGASSAGSVTATPTASAVEEPWGGGGGTVNFGQGVGPGTDDLSAPIFTPLSQTSGRLLRATPVTVNASATAGLTLECWFNTHTTPTPNAMAMAAVTTPAGDDAIVLGIWLTGTVQAFVIGDGQGVFGNQSPQQFNDGRTHHAAVTLTGGAYEAQPVLFYTQAGGPSSSGCTNSVVTMVTGGSRQDMGGASASTPNGTNPAVAANAYTFWQDLANPQRGGYSWNQVRWTLRPETDTQSTAGYFWAQQGNLEGASGATGNTWYAGLQTRSQLPGMASPDHIAIFSVWNAVAAVANTAITNAWAGTFTGEGDGYSVRIPYSWTANTTYSFRMEPDTPRGARWFAVYVRDDTTGVETWLGSIQAATSDSSRIRGVAYQWTELYSQVSAATSCPLLPRATAFFGTPTFTDTAVTGAVTVRLYVDGVQRQVGSYSRGQLGAFNQIDIGGLHVDQNFAPFAGTLSHVAVYPTALSAARIQTHYQAGATGLAGERTDQRIARIADWIGLPTSDRALDVGDKRMGPQAMAGKQPLEVMREAAQVEQGVLFISPEGKLTFHRLSRRYNRTSPDVTLDCAQAGHVQVGLAMPGDDFGLCNDMEVSRPGGATQRAVNTASIDEFGLYPDSLEIPAYSDTEAQAVGNWRVGCYGTPRIRIPNITIQLSRLHTINPSLVTAILGLRISSLVRLTNLPTQAPGTSVDVFVEGWHEIVDPAGGWMIELNCSPADHYTVATVGGSTVGSGRVAL